MKKPSKSVNTQLSGESASLKKTISSSLVARPFLPTIDSHTRRVASQCRSYSLLVILWRRIKLSAIYYVSLLPSCDCETFKYNLLKWIAVGIYSPSSPFPSSSTSSSLSSPSSISLKSSVCLTKPISNIPHSTGQMLLAGVDGNFTYSAGSSSLSFYSA